MAMTWTPRLAVGNERIDQQHQELFRRFDRLLDACRERRGKEELVDLFEFLNQYVVTHFQEEEQLMLRHGYPEISAHQALHRQFIEDMRNSSRQLRDEGPSLELVVNTNQALLHWLIRHIQQVDVQMGNYLKAQGVR